MTLFPELACTVCGGTMTKVSDEVAVCIRNETHRRTLEGEWAANKVSLKSHQSPQKEPEISPSNQT